MLNKKYAVFIDGDNISSEYFDLIMTEIVKDNDEILIKRVYGDWTTSEMNSWKEKIANSPIRVFQQFRNGPNATDNQIIMDAIELSIQNKDINAFCIVSADHGYYSLALRLRENGKYVLGIGKENSKDIWQNSCNEFVKIENILKGKDLLEINNEIEENKEKLTIKKDKTMTNDDVTLKTILNYGLENSRINADGWINLADFGTTIRTKYPSFDPRTHGSTKLISLIKKFPDDIEIKKDTSFPPNYYLRKNTSLMQKSMRRTMLESITLNGMLGLDGDDPYCKDMREGVKYYFDFLNNPTEYTKKNNCNIYSSVTTDNKEYKVMVYKFVNKISENKYISIAINLSSGISMYIVDSYKEICEQTKGCQEIKIEKIAETLSSAIAKELFKKELLNIKQINLHDFDDLLNSKD